MGHDRLDLRSHAGAWNEILTLRLRYLFRLFSQPDPIAVENAFLVDAVVGVGAEIVALGLQQIGRQPLGAIAVVVGQGRGERRRGNAQLDGRRDHVPPGRLRLGDRLGEIRGQEQVFQLRIGVEGLLDAFQEHRADDAAAAPQQRDRRRTSAATCARRPPPASARSPGRSCKSSRRRAPGGPAR